VDELWRYNVSKNGWENVGKYNTTSQVRDNSEMVYAGDDTIWVHGGDNGGSYNTENMTTEGDDTSAILAEAKGDHLCYCGLASSCSVLNITEH
jgi:hypothetical protein